MRFCQSRDIKTQHSQRPQTPQLIELVYSLRSFFKTADSIENPCFDPSLKARLFQ